MYTKRGDKPKRLNKVKSKEFQWFLSVFMTLKERQDFLLKPVDIEGSMW